jgi:hypothetical protein
MAALGTCGVAVKQPVLVRGSYGPDGPRNQPAEERVLLLRFVAAASWHGCVRRRTDYSVAQKRNSSCTRAMCAVHSEPSTAPAGPAGVGRL